MWYWKEWQELNDIRESYWFEFCAKCVKYLRDRFLGKASPYLFITMLEDFQPSIDYNNEYLKIVNSYNLIKVKWIVILCMRKKINCKYI